MSSDLAHTNKADEADEAEAVRALKPWLEGPKQLFPPDHETNPREFEINPKNLKESLEYLVKNRFMVDDQDPNSGEMIKTLRLPGDWEDILQVIEKLYPMHYPWITRGLPKKKESSRGFFDEAD